MRKKILNDSVSKILSELYDGKSLNLLLISDFILISIYSVFASLSSIFNGLSVEENLKIMNIVISLSTIVPLYIIYNHSKSVLRVKNNLLEKQSVINDVKQELGLNEISHIKVVQNSEEKVVGKRVLDVVLTDEQGNVAYLKEYIDYFENDCVTYLDEDVKKRILK